MGDLACFLSQTCSTLYSNWTFLAGELEKLVASAQPRHTHKKKEQKPHNTSCHSFFHSCSILMTVSYFYIKYKGTEKKELREIQFKKSNGRSLIWEVKKTWQHFAFETGEKTDHSLNLFLFSTFSKSFTSLLIVDWNLFIMYSRYLK